MWSREEIIGVLTYPSPTLRPVPETALPALSTTPPAKPPAVETPDWTVLEIQLSLEAMAVGVEIDQRLKRAERFGFKGNWIREKL